MTDRAVVHNYTNGFDKSFSSRANECIGRYRRTDTTELSTDPLIPGGLGGPDPRP